MIIRSIKAWNFMRFHHLELTGIPESGLFSIEGANESGKSTIAHLVHFALSGLSPHLRDAPSELINWERDQLKLELEFLSEGRNCRILRQCDRDGSSFVKLEVGGKTMAQGAQAVELALGNLLGYRPGSMSGAFLITQEAVQALRVPSPERLEEMLGLSRIKSLASVSGDRIQEIGAELEKDRDRKEILLKEKAGIGLVEDEYLKALAIKDELLSKQEELRRELEDSRVKAQALREPYRLIEQQQKHLAEKIEKMEILKLYPELPQHLAELEDLSLQGKAADCLAQSISTLRSVIQYRNACRDLSARYESQLQQIRDRLGLGQNGNAGPDSFRKQEDSASRAIRRARRSLSMCTIILLFLSVFSAAAVSAFVWQQPLLEKLRQMSLLSELDRGTAHEFWTRLKTVFARGENGLPTTPEAWFATACLLLMLLISASTTLRSRVLLARRRAQFRELSRQKEKMQDEYNSLLSADFKDMKDVGEIIRKSSFSDLKEAFSEFKTQNPLIVEKDFDTRTVFRIARSHLEESMQALNLKIYQIEASVQALEEKVACVQNEISKLLPRISDLEERRRRLGELEEEIGRRNEQSELRKKENSSFTHLVELAEGCHGMLRSRVRFSITSLYKKLLPAITDRRYAAIRLDEDFRLMVFSEDRGDFVPISQLSSGTHDLMLLMMQLILAHGFAQSRAVSRHCLFLDEPLPAVDSVRYRRLLELLPDFSPHLRQIFICRPPAEVQGALKIIPRLDSRELVADFSEATGRK